jgi:hypothetical protein
MRAARRLRGAHCCSTILRRVPVHGGAINAKRARDGAGVLAAVNQLARVLGLRRRHRRLAAELHATRLRRLQPGAEIRPRLAGAG